MSAVAGTGHEYDIKNYARTCHTNGCLDVTISAKLPFYSFQTKKTDSNKSPARSSYSGK